MLVNRVKENLSGPPDTHASHWEKQHSTPKHKIRHLDSRCRSISPCPLSLSSLHSHHSRCAYPVLELTSSPRSSLRVARPRIPHVSVITRSHGRSRRISDLVELCLGSLVTFQLSFQSKITKSGRDAKARERKGGGGLLSRSDDEWTVST